MRTRRRSLAIAVCCLAALACGPPNDEGVDFLGVDGIVLQESATDCGLAALATLARDLGHPMEYADLRQHVAVGPHGLTFLDLRTIAGAYGIALEGVLAKPGASSRLRLPWIAHFRAREGHYVVVERREGTSWILADPSRGRMRFTAVAFARAWSGYALILSSEVG